MKPVLGVQGLNKSYGALTVARDISLELRAGARHALIGPNGAGKSTLVGMLSGVTRADSGSIHLCGEDVTRSPTAHRVRNGLVRTFQVSCLFPGFSVLENVFLALSERQGAKRDMWFAAARRQELLARADEIVLILGLQDVRHRLITEIAYGQQRLVELALALALEPKVLLLDEPAAGIPSSEVGLLLDAIEGLPADIAILVIEHDMQVVRRIADTVTVLVQGAVLMTGNPTEVMSSDEVRDVYLGAAGAKRFHAQELHA